ncbi:MAG: hypothetical protein NT023_15915 [Armatimonadetes bacterium]|nr:hypothetical protein [Armatimonadota bacterium]
MKTNTVKSALKAGLPQVGTWLSLGSPMAARFMARAGFHWLTVDICRRGGDSTGTRPIQQPRKRETRP